MYHMYNNLALKRKSSALQSSDPTGKSTILPSNEDQVYVSPSITDRKSKFMAIFSPSQAYLSKPASLQQHPLLEGSMHKILGIRKRSAQQSLTSQPKFFCDSDEDGEKWAGKRVEKVLNDLGVEGVVVVGRWYGGIMLGPVRFQHIEDVVRKAVALWMEDDVQGGERKKIKTDDVKEDNDPVAKEKLIKVLQERDQSIDVLRGLLEDKKTSLAKMEKKDTTIASSATPTSSPAKKNPDYQTMDVTKLKSQEKAKDATLTWILKQIEAVEKKIEAIEFEAFAADVETYHNGLEDIDDNAQEAKQDGDEIEHADPKHIPTPEKLPNETIEDGDPKD